MTKKTNGIELMKAILDHPKYQGHSITVELDEWVVCVATREADLGLLEVRHESLAWALQRVAVQMGKAE